MIKKEIKGVKGWLLLFVVISILSLISLIYNLYSDFFIYLWGGLIGKIILVSTFMSVLLTLIYLILIFKESSYAVMAVITMMVFMITAFYSYLM